MNPHFDSHVKAPTTNDLVLFSIVVALSQINTTLLHSSIAYLEILPRH